MDQVELQEIQKDEPNKTVSFEEGENEEEDDFITKIEKLWDNVEQKYEDFKKKIDKVLEKFRTKPVYKKSNKKKEEVYDPITYSFYSGTIALLTGVAILAAMPYAGSVWGFNIFSEYFKALPKDTSTCSYSTIYGFLIATCVLLLIKAGIGGIFAFISIFGYSSTRKQYLYPGIIISAVSSISNWAIAIVLDIPIIILLILSLVYCYTTGCSSSIRFINQTQIWAWGNLGFYVVIFVSWIVFVPSLFGLYLAYYGFLLPFINKTLKKLNII